MIRAALSIGLAIFTLRVAAADGGVAIDDHASRRDVVMRAQLAKPYPPDGCWRHEDFALAAYWLNERCDEADKAIIAERDNDFPSSLKAGDFHWHAYILERIYFLFGASSKHFPGRMGAAAETALLDMLWQWAGPRARLEMTAPAHDWWIWGSENHHAQAWAGFWGAAQIFSRHPDYKSRRYADGASQEQMAEAFDGYFKRFARERAAKGLLVECNSGYNKYTLGGWYNIADFAEDSGLRRRMAMLLDLFWADWAGEQINGVRGGSRHRCYPGTDSITGTSMDGLAWFHFGLGRGKSQHPSHMCGATTFWRPSAVVSDLALDVTGRGVCESWSRRPGLAESAKKGGRPANYIDDPAHPFHSPTGVYRLRPEGGGLLRYTYGTPDFVIGTSMVEARPKEDWTNISSQNRWEGVIFAGHPTARIFAQPLKPQRGSVYNAYWSVQKRGTLIVQRLKGSNARGHRIWFDAALRRAERDGWVFAEAPRAFSAVRAVEGPSTWEDDGAEQHHEKEDPPGAGQWLRCANEFTPVIIDVARKADCASFDEFQRAALADPPRWKKGRLDYRSRWNRATLTLFADYSGPPLIDGKPVDYAPRRAFDSPFIQSDFGSGIVRIQKGNQRVTLDFN